MLRAFTKGAFLGMGLVIPLGAQNAFIFQHATLQQRFRAVLPVVLVSALCDAALILAATAGVDFLEQIALVKKILMVLGIGFLFYIGYGIWKNVPDANFGHNIAPLSLKKQILYTLSVSLLNPHAIMDTFFVIGAVSIDFLGADKHMFVLGCILIDMLWFLFLALMGFFLKKLSNGPRIIKITNRLSACIIFAIAVDLIIKLFH